MSVWQCFFVCVHSKFRKCFCERTLWAVRQMRYNEIVSYWNGIKSIFSALSTTTNRHTTHTTTITASNIRCDFMNCILSERWHTQRKKKQQQQHQLTKTQVECSHVCMCACVCGSAHARPFELLKFYLDYLVAKILKTNTPKTSNKAREYKLFTFHAAVIGH